MLLVVWDSQPLPYCIPHVSLYPSCQSIGLPNPLSKPNPLSNDCFPRAGGEFLGSLIGRSASDQIFPGFSSSSRIPWSLVTTHASYPPWNGHSSGPGCGAQDYLWLQRDGPVSVGQAAPPLALNTVFLSCGWAGYWLPTDTLHCRHILSPRMRKSPLSSPGTNVNDGSLFKVLWSLEGEKML